MPPVAHVFCPGLHVLVQPNPHDALPLLPWHVPPSHGDVVWTKRHVPSLAHWASVEPLSHVGPVAVQTLGLHVHCGDVVPVHVWLVPHGVVVTHARHPFCT